VGALVVDDVDASVGVADQNDRLAADPGGKIIAGIPYLTLMPD
jgi:hypothetical protein